MFDRADAPRVFGVSPGADFCSELITGLDMRLKEAALQNSARIEIWVNTRRMARRLTALYSRRSMLLPRIRVITDVEIERAVLDVPDPISALERRLRLVELVSSLVASGTLDAPRNAVYGLADSLAALLDEMDGEEVTADNLAELDTGDESGHWQRSVAILQAATTYATGPEVGISQERARAMVTERLLQFWTTAPPDYPIILAGSTGSRRTTRALMAAAAHLPQGAVVLPGFDFTMGDEMLTALADDNASQDHAQFRLTHFLAEIGSHYAEVMPWSNDETTARQRLVSLSLCPAPVTDIWAKAAPEFRGVRAATAGITLLEAPSERLEAQAIAIRLREAVENGTEAALVTPNRTLARRVTALLDRWKIVPDDSAGRPLPLSPPGRLLLLLLEWPDRPSVEDLVKLLRNPLVHRGAARGDHLLRLQRLELAARDRGYVYLNREDLDSWAGDAESDWVDWIYQTLMQPNFGRDAPLANHLNAFLDRAEALCAGSEPAASANVLWEEAAGR
ncbi:MAG: double-strand break repair protein AddB, partial [Pseudomonadota bacterium]